MLIVVIIAFCLVLSSTFSILINFDLPFSWFHFNCLRWRSQYIRLYLLGLYSRLSETVLVCICNVKNNPKSKWLFLVQKIKTTWNWVTRDRMSAVYVEMSGIFSRTGCCSTSTTTEYWLYWHGATQSISQISYEMAKFDHIARVFLYFSYCLPVCLSRCLASHIHLTHI